MNFFKRKILNRLFGGDLECMIEQNRVPDQAASLRGLNNLGFNQNQFLRSDKRWGVKTGLS